MINSAADLVAAFNACAGGETLTIGDIAQPVSLREKRFDKPVTITGGTIRLTSAPAYYQRTLELVNVGNVILTGLSLQGCANGDGFYGIALAIDGCSDIVIDGNEFTRCYRAATIATSERIGIRHNDVHAVQSDGFDFADFDTIIFDANHYWDFRAKMKADGTGDHPDAIQCWSVGQTKDCANIAIRNELIEFTPDGRGQGIFLADSAFGGHTDVIIEDVIITSPLWTAVQVYDCIDPMLRGITVLNLPGGPAVPGGPVIPSIFGKTAKGSGSKVDACAAPRVFADGTPDWQLPPGCTFNGDAKQADVDAAVSAWLAANRSAPAPTPSPAPTPTPTPSPAPTPAPQPDPRIAERAALRASVPADAAKLAKDAARLVELDTVLGN